MSWFIKIKYSLAKLTAHSISIINFHLLQFDTKPRIAKLRDGPVPTYIIINGKLLNCQLVEQYHPPLRLINN